MTATRTVYRLALPVYFAATSSISMLRTSMYYGKWLVLALLFLLALGAPKPAQASRLGWAGVLVVAFVLTGLLSFTGDTVTARGMLQFGTIALALLTADLLARCWQSEAGRLALLDDLQFVARLVVWSSLAMLVAGANLGRVADRFSGWSSNPNSLGAMLCLLWPVLLHRALVHPGWSPLGPRVLSVFALVVAAATGSRSALLSILISSMVLLGVTRRLRSRALASVIGLAIIWFFFGSTLSEVMRATPGLNRLVSEEVVNYVAGEKGAEFKASGREAAWAVAVRLFHARPIEGYGWGAEDVLLPQFAEELAIHEGENVHNSYLSLLLQVGLLGGVPICLAFVIAAARGIQHLRRPSELARLRVGATPVLMSVLAGALGHGFFESWLFAVGNLGTLIFWPIVFLLLHSGAAQGALPVSPQPVSTGQGPRNPAAEGIARGA